MQDESAVAWTEKENLPEGQDLHDEAARTSLYVPCIQSAHDEADDSPELGENVPVGQERQLASDVPMTVVEYLPAPQSLHSEELGASAYLPAVQESQAPAAVEPSFEVNFPAGQDWHVLMSVAPRDAENLPSGQSEQSETEVEPDDMR